MEESTTSIFSTIDLEREIKEELLNLQSIREPQPTDFAPPAVRTPAPGSNLSAENLVREYEATAKEIEAMGAELIQRVKQCEAMTRNAFALSEELRETAARYRQEAKRVFLEIENYFAGRGRGTQDLHRNEEEDCRSDHLTLLAPVKPVVNLDAEMRPDSVGPPVPHSTSAMS